MPKSKSRAQRVREAARALAMCELPCYTNLIARRGATLPTPNEIVGNLEEWQELFEKVDALHTKLDKLIADGMCARAAALVKTEGDPGSYELKCDLIHYTEDWLDKDATLDLPLYSQQCERCQSGDDMLSYRIRGTMLFVCDECQAVAK